MQGLNGTKCIDIIVYIPLLLLDLYHWYLFNLIMAHYYQQTDEDRIRVLECRCVNDEFHPDVTPIVLAAQRNEFTIVKV